LQTPDGLPHHDLGLPVGIGVGVIEEAHSEIVCPMQDFAGRSLIDLGSEGHPGADRDRAQF